MLKYLKVKFSYYSTGHFGNVGVSGKYGKANKYDETGDKCSQAGWFFWYILSLATLSEDTFHVIRLNATIEYFYWTRLQIFGGQQ